MLFFLVKLNLMNVLNEFSGDLTSLYKNINTSSSTYRRNEVITLFDIKTIRVKTYCVKPQILFIISYFRYQAV